MKTMADILRERGKLGPYTTDEPAPVDSSVVPPQEDDEAPARKRPRKTLPPVDF